MKFLTLLRSTVKRLLKIVVSKQHRVTVLVVGTLLCIVGSASFLTNYIVQKRASEERNIAAKNLMGDSNQEAYTDINGLEFDISGYTTQSVVVTSWASWCPQCVDELTVLNTIMEERGARAVPVLAINRRESKEVAARFISTLPMLSKVTFILDTTDYFFGAVEGYAMPETIVYNSTGEKIFHGRGNSDKALLNSTLDQITQ